MTQEIWKDTEYPGYQVSNLGRVKSVCRRNSLGRLIPEKIKVAHLNTSGYKQVNIWINRKGNNKFIHRLVAQAFIPNPHNWPEVNHKNGDKLDNNINNLEWSTRKANLAHARRILKRKCGGWYKGNILCVETDEVFESSKDIERKTAISAVSIRRVLCGSVKTSAGYHWKRTDRQTTLCDASKYHKQIGWQARLSKELGISPALLRWRLKNGWTWDEIRNIPASFGNRYKRNKREDNGL